MSVQHNNDNTDHIEGLPQWQKDIIDKNLKEIADNPQCLRPIEELLEELDREED
jgi:hypothetical protein